MLRRKIEERLLAWKNQKKKKALVIKGARQVGKTFAIERFGKSNYEDCLTVNFKETPSAKEIFSGDLNVDTMIMGLRFRYPDRVIEPGRTLIFLDEIQECEEAITSLKFWANDTRYDVIASGSMLGIDYKRASSYPVGYVDYETMYGLDFEEFLWSQGIEDDMINDLRKMFLSAGKVPEAVHNRMMQLWRTYIAVGGMPEAVQEFADTKDFRAVHKVQTSILTGYLYDIAHYAPPAEKIKAEKCFLSLNRQLLEKENHKFQYKEVENRGNAEKFLSSLEWLERANIVSESRNVSSVTYDLTDYEVEGNFRVYPTDLSLLIAMRDLHLKQEIVENTLSGNSKGGISECASADVLIKKQYPLHFYKNETAKKELDFLIQKDGTVIPIEVKSGNGKAASLNQLMKNNDSIPCAYKFADANMGLGENRIITAPSYMMMFL